MMKVKLNELYCNIVCKYNNVNTTNINFDGYEQFQNKGSNCVYVQCKVKDTPHFKYVSSNKQNKEYIRYAKNAGKFAGFGIEHSIKTFNTLIDTFQYDEQPYIYCNNKNNNKIVIINGLHRASMFMNKYGENHEVTIRLQQ